VDSEPTAKSIIRNSTRGLRTQYGYKLANTDPDKQEKLSIKEFPSTIRYDVEKLLTKNSITHRIDVNNKRNS